jgi:heme/copper-type cytochrome/quinol oxidase subunit 2
MINVDDATQIGHTYPVPLGQTVVLRLLSDTDQAYHVHGYDLEQKAAAGVEANFEFTADQAGSFEVESHTTNKVLAILKVS